MNQLSPRARKMLELTRNTPSPIPGTQERIERKLAVRVAAGSAAFGVGALLSKSAAGVSQVTLKAIAVVGVGATAAAVSYQSLQPSNPPERESVAPVASATSRPARPRSVEATQVPTPRPSPMEAASAPVEAPPEATVAEATVAEATVAKAAQASSARRRPSRTAAPLPTSKPTSPSRNVAAPPPALQPDPLLAELRALRNVQRALRGGDGPGALQLLQRASKQFPSGSLQQERAAAHVQALCMTDQIASAREAARQFGARWPDSSLRARVEAACE